MQTRDLKSERPLSRSLLIACVVLVSLNALHGLDHLRQGLGRLTTEVIVGGQGLLLLALVPLILTLRRHPTAPLAAAAVGLWTAVAVAASHLAPHWSAFSDPYADNNLDLISWGQMILLIAAAATLGIVGIQAMRGRAASMA